MAITDKLTSSNVSFCLINSQKPKEIQFVITEDSRNPLDIIKWFQTTSRLSVNLSICSTVIVSNLNLLL